MPSSIPLLENIEAIAVTSEKVYLQRSHLRRYSLRVDGRSVFEEFFGKRHIVDDNDVGQKDTEADDGSYARLFLSPSHR